MERLRRMTYSQNLYSRVREYLITSTDHHTNGESSPGGATPVFWMFTLPQAPSNSYDEVYPGIYMGNDVVAKDKGTLKQLGITHIINCSQGKGSKETNTDSRYYRDVGIKFHGIQALDNPMFNMMPYFKAAAEFMDKALKKEGKIYVHCFKGVSRSATIVIAYLMLKCKMDLLESVKIIRAKRKIHPNDGFVRQLCILSHDLGLDEISSRRQC